MEYPDDESAQTELLKKQFLESYHKFKVVNDACQEIGLSRNVVRMWITSDANFRMEYKNVQAIIVDEVDKMLMKHAGIIAWSPNERATRMHAHSNVRSLEIIKRAHSHVNGDVNINSTVMKLTINGITHQDLKQLVEPRKKKESDIIEVEAVKQLEKEGISKEDQEEPKQAEIGMNVPFKPEIHRVISEMTKIMQERKENET